jgi:asparagine synthetase B (glutamine-hydrolysing)
MNNTSLNGIAYTIPAESRRYLAQSIGTNLQIMTEHLDLAESLVLLDLAHVCAGRFAAKSSEPLRTRGLKVIYPFLETSLLRLAVSIPEEQKSHVSQRKALLKQLLEESIPPEWVYRQKSTFSPPVREMFAVPSLGDALHQIVLDPSNPILEYVNVSALSQMTARARAGRTLSLAAYNTLWTILFVSAWLHQ